MSPTISRHAVVLGRLLIGLSQGAALYLLTRAQQAKGWPFTDLRVHDALLDIARYAPVFAIVTIGHLRMRTAILWLGIVVLLCGGLGFYQGYRDPSPTFDFLFSWTGWLNFNFGLSALLFIGHSLTAAADADKRRIAAFPTYFDVAWQLATQLILSSLFVLLLWGILFLGAILFQAIGIDFFIKTLVKPWFSFPVTTMASSAALHLTDAHTSLVRGARNLLLNLLSWLMPIMVVIALGFLATLPFTGLQPLWKTRYATASLTTAMAILILLINSQYQDGRPETRDSRILTYSRVPAALILLPLVALAGYGLHLRVEQYGWTPSRVIAGTILVVGFCHALGYTASALASGPRMRLLPATNIASAFVVILSIVALLTPIADPARISVASQVSRLKSGAVDPDKFDFNFLRFRSARFGNEALEHLKHLKDGPNATRIAEKAARAQVSLSPYAAAIDRASQPRSTTESRTANVTMIQPKSASLPTAFLQQDWSASTDKARLPACVTMEKAAKCEAILFDLTGEADSGLILGNGTAWVFGRDSQGTWSLLGTLANTYCVGVWDAIRAGQVATSPAVNKDIVVNGFRLPILTACPPITATKH